MNRVLFSFLPNVKPDNQWVIGWFLSLFQELCSIADQYRNVHILELGKWTDVYLIVCVFLERQKRMKRNRHAPKIRFRRHRFRQLRKLHETSVGDRLRGRSQRAFQQRGRFAKINTAELCENRPSVRHAHRQHRGADNANKGFRLFSRLILRREFARSRRSCRCWSRPPSGTRTSRWGPRGPPSLTCLPCWVRSSWTATGGCTRIGVRRCVWDAVCTITKK